MAKRQGKVVYKKRMYIQKVYHKGYRDSKHMQNIQNHQLKNMHIKTTMRYHNTRGQNGKF